MFLDFSRLKGNSENSSSKKKKKSLAGACMFTCKKKCLFSELGHWQGLEEANLRFLINDSIFFFFFSLDSWGGGGGALHRKSLA